NLENSCHQHRFDQYQGEAGEEEELKENVPLSLEGQGKELPAQQEVEQADTGVKRQGREQLPRCDPEDVAVQDGLELLQSVRALVQDQDAGREGEDVEHPDEGLDIHVSGRMLG